MKLTDSEIAELWIVFKNGDRDAFGQLVSLFYKTLFNYGSKFSVDKATVEDCIQDLFLDLWRRREFIGETKHVKLYLLKALRRKILLTKVSDEKMIHSTEHLDSVEFYSTFSIENEWINNEMEDEKNIRLKTVLEKLSKREREIIYLKFYEDLDYEKISEIMAINYQSVRNLLHSAIKDLKNAWFENS